MVFGSLAWIGLAKLGETSTAQDIETKKERVIFKDLNIENIENELNEKVAAPISVVTSIDNGVRLEVATGGSTLLAAGSHWLHLNI